MSGKSRFLRAFDLRPFSIHYQMQNHMVTTQTYHQNLIIFSLTYKNRNLLNVRSWLHIPNAWWSSCVCSITSYIRPDYLKFFTKVAYITRKLMLHKFFLCDMDLQYFFTQICVENKCNIFFPCVIRT